MFCEEGTGAAALALAQAVERALIEDFAAVLSAFGADFDDVVGFGDDIEMVLDDNDGVALIDEPVEEIDQAATVTEMEADGRLFEEVEVALGGAVAFCDGGALGQLADQLQALGFTSGKTGAALAEGQVAETCFHHEL